MLQQVLLFVLLATSQAAAQSPKPTADGGLPRRADLGISLRFTEKPTVGAEVRAVAPGGFGERIGGRKGDVVTSINGHAIQSASQLEAASQLRAGQQVQLTLSRAGQTITVQGKPPEAPRETYRKRRSPL